MKATIIALSLTSLLLAIAGPTLARTQVLPPMAGMLLLGLGGIIGLVATLASAFAAIKYQAYFPAMIGSLGILPFLAVLAPAIQGMRYPAINDITTTPANPPAFVHAASLPENSGNDMDFPQGFIPVMESAYSDLAPLQLDRTPELVYPHARDVASQPPFGWKITRDDPESRTFEAVAETRLFRWKDDVVVHVSATADGGSLVHVRSRSREGKSDLGANARRIRHFLSALSEQATGSPGT